MAAITLRGATAAGIAAALLGLAAPRFAAQSRTLGGTAPSIGGVVLKGMAPVSTAPIQVHLPVPVRFELPNGLHVIVLEDRRAPQVSFTLTIPGAGGYFDPAETPGLALATAAMLSEGTASRTSDAIARQLEVESATLDVSAGMAPADATIAGACLTEHLGDVLALLADVVVSPSFPEQELQRYRQRALAGLAQQRSTPLFLGQEAIARLVNGTHPAGRTAPTPEALDRMTREAIVAFHTRRYVPDHAALAIAGDVSVSEVRRLLAATLGRWRASGAAPVAVVDPPPAPAAAAIQLVARPSSVQTTLVVGAAAVGRRSPDFYALEVMNQVIGGGPTGRLFVHLREEKGYTYGAFSAITTRRYRGYWSAMTDVGADVTGAALRDLLAEIARLRNEPVPDEELEQQKRSMVAGFALTLESPQKMLGYYVTQWTYGLPDDYWRTYGSRLMAVTAADVQRVARTYLDPARLHIVAVGDAPRIAEPLRALAPVQIAGSSARVD